MNAYYTDAEFSSCVDACHCKFNHELHPGFAGFIAWYLEKVLPSQWGPRLPWWFILSKTWWCVAHAITIAIRWRAVSGQCCTHERSAQTTCDSWQGETRSYGQGDPYE